MLLECEHHGRLVPPVKVAAPSSVLALAALFAAALAVFAVSPASAASQRVQAEDNAFILPAVAVTPGENVTFTYPGNTETHNVHFEDEGFTNPPMPARGPWFGTRTFTAGGQYLYYCQNHGGPGRRGMSGVVYVNQSGTVPGAPPTASFTVSPSVARVDQNVVFNAADTTDPDDSIVRHEWDLDGNGSYETDTGTVSRTALSYSTTGMRTIKLRVTDQVGHISETTRSLTVSNEVAGPPAPPAGPPAPPAAPPQSPTSPADTLSRKIRILSSKRLRRILRRGLRFEAAAPVSGAALRASLSVGGRTVGSARRTGLSRGRVRVTLKLSRKGKTRLRRLLANSRRARALLRVKAGGEARRLRFSIGR